MFNIRRILVIGLSIFLYTGCDEDSSNGDDLSSIDGLSLYWDHEIFGEEGRRLRFEFYGTMEFENSYDLIFEYSVDQKDISINLIDMIDNGKCPVLPKPPGNNFLCKPSGKLSIPDSLLPEGIYAFTLKTYVFEVISELIIDDEKIILNIPQNEHFSSWIYEVYPIPLNLLFGSVVFSGDENTEYALSFLDDLLTLGLAETTVPDYPYRHLKVDENGKAINRHWPPDNHSLGFVYNMDNNFKDIFNLAKEHFNLSDINIHLSSSQGDEARLNQIDGITVYYAGK